MKVYRHFVYKIIKHWCLLFLNNFYQGQEQWALDFAGEMQQEYRDNKLEEDWFYQNFYSEQAVEYYKP